MQYIIKNLLTQETSTRIKSIKIEDTNSATGQELDEFQSVSRFYQLSLRHLMATLHYFLVRKVIVFQKASLSYSTCISHQPTRTAWADHSITGVNFSGKLKYVAKWQQSGTRGKYVQVYVQNRRSVSPLIRSVEALG